MSKYVPLDFSKAFERARAGLKPIGLRKGLIKVLVHAFRFADLMLPSAE